MWNHQLYTTPANASYWNSQSMYSDTSVNIAPGETQFGFSKCQVIFNRGVEDVAVCDLSFTAIPGGGITSVLDPATHMVQAETALNSWWTTMRPLTGSNVVLASYRWYQFHAGTTKPGPAIRITPVGTAGTGVNIPLPLQVAQTVTFRTALRRHWGRVYLTGITETALASTLGRWTTTYVDAVSSAMQSLGNTVHGYAWGELVVASTKYHGVMTISQVEADDIPDVIRRRRPSVANYEKIFSS